MARQRSHKLAQLTGASSWLQLTDAFRWMRSKADWWITSRDHWTYFECFAEGLHLDCWIPARIIEVDGETGAVKLNVTPEQNLEVCDQRCLLRHRTTPTPHQLERLQAFCKDGRIDDEAAEIFHCFAVPGTGAGLAIYPISFPDVGKHVDEFLGISGSLHSLLDASSRGQGRTLSIDGFAEVFWDLVRRVQREHAEAIIHEPALSHRNRDVSVRTAYRFERELGQGTFGDVFFARCVETESRRAIKKIIKGDCVRSMQQEMQILLALDHPHIVKLYAQFEDRDHVYLVMDFCSGGDLDQAIKKRKRSGYSFQESYIADVMTQILTAIAHVHTRGILHLDLKPANIMLMPKKGTLPPSKNMHGQTLAGADLQPHVMVIDLGVADLFRPGNFENQTPAGSPAYMAPEVWSGELTPKADIFSLGVILFELLCFSRPFDASAKTHESKAYWKRRPDPNWSLMPVEDRSDIAIGLCSYMLTLERRARPTASKCIESRFIRDEGSSVAGAMKKRSLSKLNMSTKYIDRLALLPERSVLHRSVALALARAWPSNQLPTIKALFEELDAERSGRLDPVRMQDKLRRWGLERAEAVAYAMDLNRDGSVGWTEFVAACIDPSDDALKEDLKRIFDEADCNGDGKLSKRELVDLLGGDRLPEQTVQDIFDELAKHNGNVDWQAFRRFLGASSEEALDDSISSSTGDRHRSADADADASGSTEVCSLPTDHAEAGDAQQARILTPRLCGRTEENPGTSAPLQISVQGYVSQATGFLACVRGVLFPTEIDDSLLQANLIALSDMGLTNRQQNVAALRKHGNRLTNELLDDLLFQLEF